MPDDLEPVWKALASATRREMLDRLREGPMPTGELSLGFPDLSRYAVMQHLGVLEESGLVVSHKVGRTRLNFLNVVPIRMIYERWVSAYEELWADELIGLKTRIEVSAPAAPKPPTAPRALRVRRTARNSNPRPHGGRGTVPTSKGSRSRTNE